MFSVSLYTAYFVKSAAESLFLFIVLSSPVYCCKSDVYFCNAGNQRDYSASLVPLLVTRLYSAWFQALGYEAIFSLVPG